MTRQSLCISKAKSKPHTKDIFLCACTPYEILIWIGSSSAPAVVIFFRNNYFTQCYAREFVVPLPSGTVFFAETADSVASGCSRADSVDHKQHITKNCGDDWRVSSSKS